MKKGLTSLQRLWDIENRRLLGIITDEQAKKEAAPLVAKLKKS